MFYTTNNLWSMTPPNARWNETMHWTDLPNARWSIYMYDIWDSTASLWETLQRRDKDARVLRLDRFSRTRASHFLW